MPFRRRFHSPSSSSDKKKTSMWKTKMMRASFYQAYRRYSRVAPPQPEVIRVTNNIAHLGPPKTGPLPRQLMSLPPFPGHPLPGKNAVNGADGDVVGGHVTAISWVKYYFEEVHDKTIQSHFTKGLVSLLLFSLLIALTIQF